MEKKFWNEDAECMPRDGLRELQWKKLRKQMRYVYYHSNFYREQFQALNIHPDEIKDIEEFRKLPPFINKEKDRLSQEKTRAEQGHPWGEYLCTDPRNVRAIHTTSGTTGLPVFEAFTEHDIRVQSEVVARAFWRQGVRTGDRVIHGFGLSMWLAGLSPLRALEFMGALGVPCGAEGGAERFLQFAQLTKPKHMLVTPSFAEYLIKKAPEIAGIEVRELGIETIQGAAEPGAGIPETRKKIQDAFGAKLYDATGGIWGLFATSCDAEPYQGMHLVGEDYFLMDLVDPKTKEPVDMSGPTATGEWVLTGLEWEAAPAFRYASADIIEIMNEPCMCGMPGMRMRYLGRADDLLIVKGVNVYPAAIKGVVDAFYPRVTSEIKILLDEPPPRVVPPLKMKVEYGPGVSGEEINSLKEEIEQALSTKLRIRPSIEMVPPNTLEKDPTKKAKLIEKLYT
jgi:phenylacetate-CoA ligase